MCSIKRTYIPEKYNDFWEEEREGMRKYRHFLFISASEDSMRVLLLSIGHSK